MDYKEIRKKDGKVIIFCDFEDLIKEATGYDIDDALENLPGNKNEIICHCPFCKVEGHTKHKLYIKRDLTVGNCFVCDRAFVHTTNDLRVDYNIPSFTNHFNYNITLPNFTKTGWNLDTFNNDFEDNDTVGETYLSNRYPMLLDIARLLGFKYTNGNVVIPFRYKGNVVYYQIRFSNPGKIKYFFPPVDNKIPYILDFGEGKRRLIICEGVFDAISLLFQAPDYIPIAVLGSSISDYQINFLREYNPVEILVMMDESEISNRIASRIKETIDYCPVKVIPTYGPDPEEILKSRMEQGKPLQWIKPQLNEPQFKIQVPNLW